MAWRDTLRDLKVDLADIRAQRRRQTEEDQGEIDRQRRELIHLADTLQISELLTEMNASLLEGAGEVEKIISWEPYEGDDEALELEDETIEEADVISGILTWQEGGDRELAVDLGISDNGTYLQVNNIDIRPEKEALEKALVEGFRDELEI